MAAGSELEGVSVGEFWQRSGVSVLARKPDSLDLEINPTDTTLIQAGDLLIVFGSAERMLPLENR